MNAAIDDCSITKLKIVVLDELHMIDDDYRGYLMELLGTKLLCLGQQVQMVGMSATLTVSVFGAAVCRMSANHPRISTCLRLGYKATLMRPGIDLYQ